MKLRPVVGTAVAMFVGVVVGAWLVAAEAYTPGGDDPPATIKSLLDRVVQLEARVEQLEKRQPIVALPQPPATTPVPRDWQPHQFNGQTYYIVPLNTPPANARPK